MNIHSIYYDVRIYTYDGHTTSFGKLFATVTVSENQKKVKLSSRQVPREIERERERERKSSSDYYDDDDIIPLIIIETDYQCKKILKTRTRSHQRSFVRPKRRIFHARRYLLSHKGGEIVCEFQ